MKSDADGPPADPSEHGFTLVTESFGSEGLAGVAATTLELAVGVTGPMEWGRSTVTAATAASRGMAIATVGTLPAKYAPAECR